ncbi:hypothetical protein [Streptomyces natalensis]|uniref:hypothetical protein n=1 Tax=Streptomyces natalensis TaxID=68242 RepID=UPI000A542F27|nr:hypothetical protein [Streptomyces natalensis]
MTWVFLLSGLGGPKLDDLRSVLRARCVPILFGNLFGRPGKLSESLLAGKATQLEIDRAAAPPPVGRRSTPEEAATHPGLRRSRLLSVS